MNASTFKNFFSVRLINQQVKIKPKKDYFSKTARSPFNSARKTKELLLVNSMNKSLTKTSRRQYSRNQPNSGLPKINSAANLIKIETYGTFSQTSAGQKSRAQNSNKYILRQEQSGSMSPESTKNTKFRSQAQKLKISIPKKTGRRILE